MSKVMRSAKPASGADRLGADHAGRGAGQDGAHRHVGRGREADDAAVGLGEVRRSRHAERFQPRAEAADVVAHHRPEIGVQHHRRQPLEFAELGRDLVAGRNEGVGQLLAQDGDRALLVVGPDEAIEEGHGDRLHARRLQGPRGGAHPVLVERRVDLAGVAQALGHFQPQVARHQGLGLVGLDVVEVGPLLAADLQQVAEAVGGHQPGLDAAVLDQGVGRHRGAVAEIDDRRGRTVRCASGATRRMPSSTPSAMPRDGSSGVDGTFQVSTRPACSSNRQMSVKVPPESTPTRHRAMPFLVFPLMPASMLAPLFLLLCAPRR